MLGVSMFFVCSQILDFKATQLMPLAIKLPLNVTSVTFQFLIDLLIFDTTFSAAQIALVCVITALSASQIIYYVYTTDSANKKKD